MKNKILMVLTNIDKYKNHNRATGLWLGEAIHFYEEVINAGFEVDFVSPNGGYVPIDPHSLKPIFLKEVDYKWYGNDIFKEKVLAKTLLPKEVNSDDYLAIYYTGGHGVMWDFPDNKEIQNIAMNIYNKGGYVTAVCHGVVGLLNLKEDNGEYLIKNKKVTGFANIEEFLNGTIKKVPFLTETELKNRGAIYKRKRAFSSYVIKDERLITGQNPFSPRQVGVELVKELLKGK